MYAVATPEQERALDGVQAEAIIGGHVGDAELDEVLPGHEVEPAGIVAWHSVRN